MTLPKPPTAFEKMRANRKKACDRAAADARRLLEQAEINALCLYRGRPLRYPSAGV